MDRFSQKAKEYRTIWYIRRADGTHGMNIEGAWRRNGPPESWLSMGVTRFNLWPHKAKSIELAVGLL